MGRPRQPLSEDLLALDWRMRHGAASQGGVITAPQCRALGADASAIRRLLGAGCWGRARRGVYLPRPAQACSPGAKPDGTVSHAAGHALGGSSPLVTAAGHSVGGAPVGSGVGGAGVGSPVGGARVGGAPVGSRVGGAPEGPAADHHVRCAALLAALSPARAVVSHLSAARLLGLPLPPGATDDLVITRPTPAPANRLGARTSVHVDRFEDSDVLHINGVPVLGGARLVLDCCAVTGPDSALAIADAAVARGLTTPDELDEELCRRRGSRGVPVATLVVERLDPLAESWFESMSRWWLLEAGLPRPELQVRFADEHGRVRARVDMWFPEHRTVGEADGAGKYAEPGALFAEKQREDWLRDAHRAEVVRWVPREMRSPAGRREVVARFERAFIRGSR